MQKDINEFTENVKERVRVAMREAEALIEKMVEDVYNRFKYRKCEYAKNDMLEYVKINKSFVTPFLFQPPAIWSVDKEKQGVINNILKDWQPTEFVEKYKKQLDERFRDHYSIRVKV